MKFGVITFPGSNCDMDMVYALETGLGQEVEQLWHKDKDLKGCDFIIVPGGFSYGDYLRSGAIARFSPIMEKVQEHAKNGGYVLGVCNGFQILCEAGLLPGALLHNDSHKFVCKNVALKPVSEKAAMSKNLDNKKSYTIPIAHGEGRYYASDEVLKELESNGQILFKYVDEKGEVSEAANPNGSEMNIAGISNDSGNVFGMMPHPERAADKALGNVDGREILEALINSINNKP
jgi:phosphoribosylformylglycinamidine synthase